jgi:20S proteasome subunit alpha 5
MTLAEAQKLALSILKQVMEEKLTAKNVEVAIITPAEEVSFFNKYYKN